jgi:hypothetical protein
MRKHDLHLERRQSWCVSTDPEFSRKAADVVGLYLNPPENASQVFSRPHEIGYVKRDAKSAVDLRV